MGFKKENNFLTSEKSFSECEQNLKNLVKEFKDKKLDLNEAQTRFHLIDGILENCLNWSKKITSVEVYQQDNGYTDYELGSPRRLIVEAKRIGKTFQIPVGGIDNPIVDINLLCQSSIILKDSIEQVQKYCALRGVPVAVVTNGLQFVIFIACKFDGKAPLEGKALVFYSLEDLLKQFHLAWTSISYKGIIERRIYNILEDDNHGIPPKWSTNIPNYKSARYTNELQTSLRQLAEILIQDIPDNDKLEKQFYDHCYCESGALSQYTLLSKELIKARYSSLFKNEDNAPSITSVKPSKKIQSIDSSVFTEALTKRPIVLIGDVGVGKTSFMRNLIYSSDFEEFREAIYLYIDLGSKATLTDDLRSFILDEIESQLINKYDIDIYEQKFVNGVYSKDILKFSKSVYSPLKESNPQKYEEEKIRMLSNKIENKVEHIKQSINYHCRITQKQIIICLDNADQRNFDFQQQAFIISQEFSRTWDMFVFIAIRPQTFYRSKKSGIFTAYPHKVFTISPPRVDEVIKKRLQFALKMSKGELPLELRTFVRLNLESIVKFIKVLLYSLQKSRELNEFLVNITGGNCRQALEFVTSFIGSPNVEATKIIAHADGGYIIPVHEFSKQALLGNYSYYDPETSIALNLFDIILPNASSHFLMPLLLAYLTSPIGDKDKDNFYSIKGIYDEMQNLGFSIEQIDESLKRLTNKKLIEITKRFSFEEDNGETLKDMPREFRITTIGEYHLKKWMGTFAYLDAVVVDTPILDKDTDNLIGKNVRDFDIEKRYIKTLEFKNYLIRIWSNLISKPSYFDFEKLLMHGEDSFEKVKKVIDLRKN